MRTELTAWARGVFGDIEIHDVFNLKENIQQTKDGRRIRELTLFIKKKKGIQQDWLTVETFNRWRDELGAIVGDNLKFELKSAEGNEMCHMGGVVKRDGRPEEYIEADFNYYSYQFNLVVWKKY